MKTKDIILENTWTDICPMKTKGISSMKTKEISPMKTREISVIKLLD